VSSAVAQLGLVRCVKVIALIGIVLAAVAGFFAWANVQSRRAHGRSTRSDVEAALEEFVSPDSTYHDTWDLFLSSPIDDPYLESIRQRCHAAAGGLDGDPIAIDRVRAILSELRQHT
jgi:hypothetical protein